MAKASFDPTPDTVAIESVTLPTPEPKRRRLPAAPVRVSVDVELSPAVFTPGYAQRGLELVLNTTAQRVTLKLLTASLVAGKATLLDGTPIKRGDGALAWLLEQLAVRLPQPLLDELLAEVD